jgi:hypothetical protein
LLRDMDDAKLDLLHLEAQHPISSLLALYAHKKKQETCKIQM